MTAPALFYTVLALGKETTWGTSVARTAFLPIENPRFQPKALRNILDTGLRGRPSLEYDLIAGPGEGMLNWSGNVYADTFPNLMVNMLGADTVTGTATPFTHTIKPQTAQPSSHSVEWQTNTQTYLFAGTRLSQCTLNFQGADGLLTYQAQAMSKLGTTTSATSAAFTTVQAMPGWSGNVTFSNDATPAPLFEGSIQFTRALRPVHPMQATQDVADLVALTLQVTMRLSFEFTQTTEYNFFTTNPVGNGTITATWTDSGANTVAVKATKAGWRLAEFDQSNNIYTVVAQINALDNTTDGGPAQVIVTNSTSTAY